MLFQNRNLVRAVINVSRNQKHHMLARLRLPRQQGADVELVVLTANRSASRRANSKMFGETLRS